MTPGPVERKFAYVHDPKRYAVIRFRGVEDGPGAYWPLQKYADAISAAHESAIAEAVKAAVERCAKIICHRCKNEYGPDYYLTFHQGMWIHREPTGEEIVCDANEIRRAQGATHG